MIIYGQYPETHVMIYIIDDIYEVLESSICQLKYLITNSKRNTPEQTWTIHCGGHNSSRSVWQIGKPSLWRRHKEALKTSPHSLSMRNLIAI